MLKLPQHVKGGLCLGSLEAFKVSFLFPAERWAAVDKAESVLKEQPLYQATSQHRVSTERSLGGKRSVSVSTPGTNGKRVGNLVMAVQKKMTLNQ